MVPLPPNCTALEGAYLYYMALWCEPYPNHGSGDVPGLESY